MKDYEISAREFLEKANTSLEIQFAGMYCPEWDKKHRHNTFRFTLYNPNGMYSGMFYDSYANTKASIERHKTIFPTSYDILACLTACDPGTFRDFCDCFGYDNDSISAFYTYRAVCDEYRGLKKIFTPNQLEKLADIQ